MINKLEDLLCLKKDVDSSDLVLLPPELVDGACALAADRNKLAEWSRVAVKQDPLLACLVQTLASGKDSAHELFMKESNLMEILEKKKVLKAHSMVNGYDASATPPIEAETPSPDSVEDVSTGDFSLPDAIGLPEDEPEEPEVLSAPTLEKPNTEPSPEESVKEEPLPNTLDREEHTSMHDIFDDDLEDDFASDFTNLAPAIPSATPSAESETVGSRTVMVKDGATGEISTDVIPTSRVSSSDTESDDDSLDLVSLDDLDALDVSEVHHTLVDGMLDDSSTDNDSSHIEENAPTMEDDFSDIEDEAPTIEDSDKTQLNVSDNTPETDNIEASNSQDVSVAQPVPETETEKELPETPNGPGTDTWRPEDMAKTVMDMIHLRDVYLGDLGKAGSTAILGMYPKSFLRDVNSHISCDSFHSAASEHFFVQKKYDLEQLLNSGSLDLLAEDALHASIYLMALGESEAAECIFGFIAFYFQPADEEVS